MLVELQALLPKGHPVYVLFDSWYASAKLIKFCRQLGWHVICALKFNRRIDKKRIDQHDLALKHSITSAYTECGRPKTTGSSVLRALCPRAARGGARHGLRPHFQTAPRRQTPEVLCLH